MFVPALSFPVIMGYNHASVAEQEAARETGSRKRYVKRDRPTLGITMLSFNLILDQEMKFESDKVKTQFVAKLMSGYSGLPENLKTSAKWKEWSEAQGVHWSS